MLYYVSSAQTEVGIFSFSFYIFLFPTQRCRVISYVHIEFNISTNRRLSYYTHVTIFDFEHTIFKFFFFLIERPKITTN